MRHLRQADSSRHNRANDEIGYADHQHDDVDHRIEHLSMSPGEYGGTPDHAPQHDSISHRLDAILRTLDGLVDPLDPDGPDRRFRDEGEDRTRLDESDPWRLDETDSHDADGAEADGADPISMAAPLHETQTAGAPITVPRSERMMSSPPTISSRGLSMASALAIGCAAFIAGIAGATLVLRDFGTGVTTASAVVSPGSVHGDGASRTAESASAEVVLADPPTTGSVQASTSSALPVMALAPSLALQIGPRTPAADAPADAAVAMPTMATSAPLSDGPDLPDRSSFAAVSAEAAAGNAAAQHRLAEMYDKGTGIGHDIVLAKLWYERAAAKGHAGAMYAQAALILHNEPKPDYALALDLFRRAGMLGHRDSQFNAGVLLARGLGAKADLASSYAWFGLAAQLGDGDAAIKREEVAKGMTSEDLARARTVKDKLAADMAKGAASRAALRTDLRSTSPL